jgi:hypothetical protein
VKIVEWFKGLSSRRDEAARERAASEGFDTKAERAASAGGIEGVTADEQAARLIGEGTSMRDVDRLGE